MKFNNTITVGPVFLVITYHVGGGHIAPCLIDKLAVDLSPDRRRSSIVNRSPVQVVHLLHQVWALINQVLHHLHVSIEYSHVHQRPAIDVLG